MPGGVPCNIRCYVSNDTVVCYTVVYTRKEAVERAEGYPPGFPYRSMSPDPFHPQGVSLWAATQYQPVDTLGTKPDKWHWPPAVGRKHPRLGQRIAFSGLTRDCQRVVIQDYEEIWRCRIPQRFCVLKTQIGINGGETVFAVVDGLTHGNSSLPIEAFHFELDAKNRATALNLNPPGQQPEPTKRRKATKESHEGRSLRSIRLD